jgi:hypothetical protein
MGELRSKGSVDNNLNGLAYNYDNNLNKLTKILKLRQGDCLKQLEDLWDAINRPLANKIDVAHSKISSVALTASSNNLVKLNCRQSPFKQQQPLSHNANLVLTNSVI